MYTLSASIFFVNSDLQNTKACSSDNPAPFKNKPYC